jgi:hypothetical protein
MTEAGFKKPSCTDILIRSVDLKTLPKAEREKRMKEYVADLQNAAAIYEYAKEIASRHPGVTIRGAGYGDVWIRKSEYAKSGGTGLSVSASGSASFGGSKARTEREERYAELVFAKDALDFEKFSHSSTGRAADESRIRILRNRIAELEKGLR